MPDSVRQRVLEFSSPDLRDLFFWEEDTLSRADYTDLVNDTKRAYETAHPDTAKFPNHKLCFWEHDPDFQSGADGQDSLRVRKYYVADRADQDNYNFECVTADIGGTKFDVVRRTYVTPRSSWSESSPALGAAMSTAPSGKFDPGYTLTGREQKRIGRRELDSMYVVEVRTYMRRVELIDSRYDESTNGPLRTIRTIYVRNEIYEGTTAIEDAVNIGPSTVDYWKPTAAGQISEFQQVSADAWVVTTQDLIPQFGLPGSPSPVFGGTVLREYETSVNYTWPGVLADGTTGDGSTTNGSDNVAAFQLTQWMYKTSGSRYYVRPVYKRTPYSGPCPAVIHEEWLTQAQLDAAEAANQISQGTDLLDPQRITFACPFFTVNTPPVLHDGATLQADTGTEDPTWGQNNGSTTIFPDTTPTDWPSSLVADVKVQPFRGGYLVRQVSVRPPNYAS